MDQMSSVTPKQPIIITHFMEDMFPLLEMPSQLCTMPLSVDEQKAVQQIENLLDKKRDDVAGLSAVQIGIPKRIFSIIDKNKEIKTFINPKVIYQSKEKSRKLEECLSLPHIYVSIRRSKTIIVEYFDKYGQHNTERFTGSAARCILHETDHLHGVLITKYLDEDIKKTRNKVIARKQRIAKATKKRRAKKKRK